MDNEKAKLEKEREELTQERMEQQKRALDDTSGLQMRMAELQERERQLTQRENSLNEQMRSTNAYIHQPLNQGGYYGYGQQPQYSMQQPEPYASDLFNRAQSDGIRLNTAGSMRGFSAPLNRPAEAAPAFSQAKSAKTGFYNVGLTLFKSAIIILCIMAFESLAVFFARDYLGVSVLYPIIAFGVGFIAFIVCAIMYAAGYKSHVRRKKHPSYVLTAAIIFVISVIAVTMVAVYFKAQVSIPSQLLTFVVIPVIYLINVLLFVAFYYAFSLNSNKR